MRNWWFKLSARLRKRTRFFEDVYVKNPDNIHLGESSKILRGAALIATQGTIAIGNRVHVNRHVSINAEKRGAEVILEDGVEINDGSLLLARGRILIRRNAILGPGVKLISYQHTFADTTRTIKEQPCVNDDIEIGEGSWIGANAVVMAGVRVGRGAVIGAGAIVTRDIPDLAVAVGCPARVIKVRSAATETSE
jgi:acetyltransferase-like isoleucine patch superfamily enzyme